MSAPSWAIFFKDNEMVGQCFVNCGWTYDEARTLNQVLEHLKSNDFEYDHFKAYGVEYKLQRDEIPGKIVQLQIEARDAWNKRKQEILDSKHEIAIVERDIPNLSASEILDVQPMRTK